jgi:hypothetical protein
MKSTYLLLLLLTTVNACQSQSGNSQINAEQFEKGIQSTEVQLLDVRTAIEYKKVHIAKSLQADWNDKNQFKDRTAHLDKSKTIYVYCLSGGRSAAAAQWMRDAGFKEVLELKGGINSWISNSKPVEGGNELPQMSLTSYQLIASSAPVVLIDFGATWCPPCKKMEPILNELLAEKGNQFKLAKVDGGNDYEVMKAQNVEALPVFILYKSGKEVWRHQGIISKQELSLQIQKNQ